MSNNYKNILWAKKTQGTRFGGSPLMFCGLMFLMFFSSLTVVGQGAVTPSYNWLDAVSFGAVSPGETSELTIAIDTDSNGNVYRLTFGDGVLKYDSKGTLIGKIINANQLNDPLDIALDSNDNIYVIDYEDQAPFKDNGKIKIFNPLGFEINQIWTSYFRPLGLTLDNDDSIYVVIYNDGSGAESTVSSELRVYNNNGILVKKTEGPSGHPLKEPYRIGVDSKKNIYISHTANGGEVLVLNSSYQYLTTLTGMGSPGSVIIDDEDFIHVIDYANRIDFSQLLNYEGIGFFDAIILFNSINNGINNKEFSIRIYDENRILKKTFKDNLELPIDLAFYSCGDRMYVNNSKTNGLSLEFELEIYQRTPSFDAEKPVIVNCVPDQNVDLVGGVFILPEYSSLAVFSAIDNCDKDLTITQDPPKNTSISATTPVTITAKDDAGNISDACTFQVIVKDNTDTEKPEITCPTNITQNLDAGQCGAIVTYPNATATDNNGSPTITRISGPASGYQFPVGITTITFEAKDVANNSAQCSFTITVVDNKKPTISCPGDISETVAFGETGKIVNYTAPAIGDNCAGATLTRTAGQAPGTNFPIGSTVNTFVVTDALGNTETCSFEVIITENADTEKPVITCRTNITQNVDAGQCIAIVTYSNATATDNNGSPTITRISGPASGSQFPVGSTTITFEAEDTAGNKAECSFTITVIDNEDPKITCPSDKTENYDPAIGFKLPDYAGLGITNDNCGFVKVTQFPAIGTLVTGNTEIILTATDEADNSSTCTFMVNLSENEVLEVDCPLDQIGQLNENCQFTIPDYRGLATVNFQNAIITQSPLAGTIVSATTIIKLTAALNGQMATCEFQLIPKDSIDPVVICPGDQNETFNPENGFSLPNYSLQAQASDNCAVAKIDQIPDIGTVIFEDTEVTIRIEDISGNSDTCTFNVILTEENTANTPPIATNDNYSTNRDTSLSIPALGVLGNDSDADNDLLTAIIQIQPTNGSVNLNPNGSFSYIPNSGFTGEDSFSYVANDGKVDSNEVIVTIKVIAVIQPSEETFEHIFIYPNPASGPFTFDTPSGWSIDKVEVFDARGRYVLTEIYSENQVEYSMDLSRLQQAVYILKLHTSQGIRVIRVIID